MRILAETGGSKPNRATRNRWIGTKISAVAIIFGISLGVWMIFGAPPPLSTAVVASFRAQFRPGIPRAGWHYVWNADAEIGKTNGYRELVWNGGSYGSDDDPQFPRAAPAGWVNVSRVGGHPGFGRNQNRFDTYAIVGFTVTNTGCYIITNSFIMRDDGDFRGDINLRVFVNEQRVGSELIANTKMHQPFDRSLGTLQSGDTLFVAIGPNGVDYNDHFVLDFEIVKCEVGNR
jgi:hypothetical protein